MFNDFQVGSDGLHYGIMGTTHDCVSSLAYCKNNLGMHRPFILTETTMETLKGMASINGLWITKYSENIFSMW